jgi:hypothetical protein
MADYLGEELAKVLDQYDERRRAVLAREQKVKDDDALFVKEFAELRKTLVRPVFEAAAAILAERGHKVSISEQEFSVDAASKVTEAQISIHIQDKSLTVATRNYNKTIWIDAGKPQETGGGKSTYSLEKITRQLVEEELVRFVAGIVAA